LQYKLPVNCTKVYKLPGNCVKWPGVFEGHR